MDDSSDEAQASRFKDTTVWRSAGLALAAFLALALAPIQPIYFPVMDQLQPADAVMVMGPPEQSRLDLARDLVERGYAQEMVISAGNSPGPYSIRSTRFCMEPQVFPVHCEQSAPFTTEGEVAFMARLAEDRSWDSVIFITFTPHVTRAQLYADRCFPGTSVVLSDGVEQPLERLAIQYFYQTGGFVKALFTSDECP
ncbi:YdcF family protein [Pseudoclavibacter helvolus]|uniref:YdcF family protein n=1 Tax=Pseudoclavibacter helvolus TaxID=255205 RepID=UPI003C74A41F